MSRIIVPVSDIDSLAVFGRPLLCRIIIKGRRVHIGDRISLCELAGRIDLAGNQIINGSAAGLTGQISVQYGSEFHIPLHLDGRTTGEDTDNIRISGSNCFKNFNLNFRDSHVLPVKSLGLTHLIKAKEIQNDIRLSGCLDRFILQRFIRVTVSLIPPRGCNNFEIRSGRRYLIERFKFCRVDHGGSCTLIAGNKCEISYHRDFGPGSKRKDFSFIFQQDRTLRSCLSCKSVMSFHVKFRAVPFSSLRCLQNGIQKIIHTDIQFLSGERAAFDCLKDLTGRVKTRIGHLEIAAAFDSFYVVIGSAPVRDDHSVISPFPSENINEQVTVFICILPVDLIVAGHKGLRSALFNSDFECSQVNFPQRSLVYDRIHGHTSLFLTVDRKMLDAGAHALALNAADIGRGHLSGKIRIFRKIFKIPTA